MARPPKEADELILRISKKFSDKQYADISKRERGLNVPMNFNVDYILLSDLRQNMMIPDLLTPQERDNLINSLI